MGALSQEKMHKKALTNVAHLDLVGNDGSMVKLDRSPPRQEDVGVCHGLDRGAVWAGRNVTQDDPDSGRDLTQEVPSNHLVEAGVGRGGGVQSEVGPAVFGVDDVQPRVFHEDEVVLKPVDGGLGVRGYEAGEGEGLAFAQGDIFGLFAEKWQSAIDNLALNGFLKLEMASEQQKEHKQLSVDIQRN